MDRDNASTATQEKSGLTRRGVMRKTAIGIGATATAGYGIASDRGPVGNAQAFPPALIPAAAAVGVIAYGELIAGPDDEEVADALDYQSHVTEYTRAREDQLVLDETLASLNRDVQLVQNKAREEAIFKVYEAGVDHLSEADATDNAEAAIQDAYATVERSILQTWATRYQRAKSLTQTDFHNATNNDVLRNWSPEGQYVADNTHDGQEFEGHSSGTKEHTLVDGSGFQMDYTYAEYDTSGTYFDPTRPVPNQDDYSNDFPTALSVEVPDPEDYGVDETNDFEERTSILHTVPFGEVYHDLMDEYDLMIAEVPSIVDTYYQPAVDGDIDLHNLIGPAHLSDTASTAEDYQEAAMALRAMGYPMSDQVCTVSITDDEGETHERIGRLSWTAHSGNMLTVGSELNPDNIVGSVFLAYNEPQDDGSIVGQTRELNRPFTIETAEGSDGVSFEDRTLAEADTQLTNEEIQELFAEHYAANEEARENVHDTATDGGGAGGFLDGESDIRTLGIVAGGAALAALLFGNN